MSNDATKRDKELQGIFENYVQGEWQPECEGCGCLESHYEPRGDFWGAPCSEQMNECTADSYGDCPAMDARIKEYDEEHEVENLKQSIQVSYAAIEARVLAVSTIAQMQEIPASMYNGTMLLRKKKELGDAYRVLDHLDMEIAAAKERVQLAIYARYHLATIERVSASMRRDAHEKASAILGMYSSGAHKWDGTVTGRWSGRIGAN